MQYYLIMIDWPKHMIQKINLEIIIVVNEQVHNNHRGIRLISLEKICTPQLSGGLDILNLHLHMLARKATFQNLLKNHCLGQDCYVICLIIWKPSHWDTNHWDVVFGKLDRRIKGCLFSSKLLKYWKEVLHHIKWRGRNSESGNSLRLESLH